MDDAHHNYYKYLDMQSFQWIDDLQFYVPFDNISDISGQCVDDNEWFMCSGVLFTIERIWSQAGLETGTAVLAGQCLTRAPDKRGYQGSARRF